MLPATEQLLILQDRDRKILQATAEREGLAVERRAVDARSVGAEAALEVATQQAKEIEAKRAGLEMEIQGQEEAVTKYSRQQLDTKNNVEYQALTREIDGCKKRISGIEDQVLELLEEADTQQQIVAAAQADLDAARADQASAGAAIDEREKNLGAYIEETQAARDALAGEIEDVILTRYERLFTKKAANTVVGIQHSVCGGCHMKLPPSSIIACKAAAEINFCPHCGVIIYYTPDMILTDAAD